MKNKRIPLVVVTAAAILGILTKLFKLDIKQTSPVFVVVAESCKKLV